MFPFFRTKKNNKKPRLSLVDTHSHLLPELDDGATSIMEAISMIEQLQELGFNELTATPHVYYEFYPNTKESILAAWNRLQNELQIKGIDVQLNVGAEYFMDEHFMDLLKTEELLTLSDNSLLVEMSLVGKPMNLDAAIWAVKAKGYTPILAHPERYLYLQEEDYIRLSSYGCKFQLNVGSLGKQYGAKVQKRAFKLINKQWIHCLGTDIHRPQQIKRITKIIHSALFENISLEVKNPNLIENSTIT